MSTTLEELASVSELAALAAPVTEAASDAERASWLRAVANDLDAHVAELVELADSETHLGSARLTGEVARTTGQLRLFADVITEGSYLEATIDHASSTTSPPRPDLRRMLRPIGPVAVFSASNFPFAFSVAGGDTASALAVGCPVLVKAHSGHLALSRRTAELVLGALERSGAPLGTFALVEGRAVGKALVQTPAIQGVGFTGSVGAGRALFDLAVSRPDPIPFYGELGSINPVVITQAAAAARGQELADGLASSFTMGVGQFCTKPGVVFIPENSGFEALLAGATEAKLGGALLTDRIAEAFPRGLQSLAADSEVEVVLGNIGQDALADGALPVILATTAAAVRKRPETLLEECFGPMTLLVRYSGEAELGRTLSDFQGSLTATIHAEPSDGISPLVALLSNKAGRVLFGGWPTGVSVAWAQQHGGPWPATTSLHTSVGATAVRRFLRPVAYQDAPDGVLHPALQESNPLGIPRRVDGVLKLGRFV